jgi:hypothetical protein
MHYFLAVVGLLGLGVIGLLIETHKQDKAEIARVKERNENQYNIITSLMEEREKLAANQKPVPWNKGKKYKLPRGVNGKPLPKETTYVLSDAPIVAAWDKDGNQTVSPQWENLG